MLFFCFTVSKITEKICSCGRRNAACYERIHVNRGDQRGNHPVWFLALLFMDFGIGADLGINLAKGIVFSFISVMVFLPALILCIYRMIDKTQHKAFLPSFGNVNKVLSKIAIPAVVIISIMIIPAF